MYCERYANKWWCASKHTGLLNSCLVKWYLIPYLVIPAISARVPLISTRVSAHCQAILFNIIILKRHLDHWYHIQRIYPRPIDRWPCASPAFIFDLNKFLIFNCDAFINTNSTELCPYVQHKMRVYNGMVCRVAAIFISREMSNLFLWVLLLQSHRLVLNHNFDTTLSLL